jgi:pyridoxamine 5'-phosphate oxidase
MKNLAEMREDYRLQSLDITDVKKDPIEQFQIWMKAAIDSEILEPNAMTLATATPDGKPSARIVLLKGIEDGGFVFYTNYESHKAKEMEKNPQAALVFNWLDLQRQIRIEGEVKRLDKEVSEAYFQSRPRGSQIGAWVSPQSSIIEDRSVIDKREAEVRERFKDKTVLPIPDFWGGYVVRPEVFEFWQGRSSRLHDRIRYRRRDGLWIRERLAP